MPRLATDEEAAAFVPRIRRGPDLHFDWAIQVRPGRWQKTSGFHWHTADESEVTGPGWRELTVVDPALNVVKPEAGKKYKLDGQTVKVLAVQRASCVVEHTSHVSCLGHVVAADSLRPMGQPPYAAPRPPLSL